MKNIFFAGLSLLFAPAAFSQATPAFGGTLTCKIDGVNWNGKIVAATYSKAKDYIALQFTGDGDTSELNVYLKGVKQYMQPYIPYRDMYEVDYGKMVNADVYIYMTYRPNKHAYLREYRMLNAEMSLDRLNLESGTLTLAFESTLATMKDHADRRRTIMQNLQKLEITEAETSEIKFLSF
jgi:hypothetical protein